MVNEITICIVFTVMVMAGWYAEVVDVLGAFLHGKYDEGMTSLFQSEDGRVWSPPAATARTGGIHVIGSIK